MAQFHAITSDVDTYFARSARKKSLRPDQFETVVGSLLGDGTLLKTTAGHCFRVHHGTTQKFLVDWKYRLLAEYVQTPPKHCGRGYYFRTVTHPEFSMLHDAFYGGCGRKSVPMTLLGRWLTPRAVAVWIMDDGAADGNQVRLNTQCFSIEEAMDLARLLERLFGMRVTLNHDKGKPRLRIAAESMTKLTALVLPYILPEMRYKVPGCT